MQSLLMSDDPLFSKAEQITRFCQTQHLTLGCAESCTVGLISSVLGSIPGCSHVLRGGIVAYQRIVKEQILQVPPSILDLHGEVSRETALSMASGLKTILSCDWAIATTGIAGPSGGTPENPVGTVWIALSGPQSTSAQQFLFTGTRNQIRLSAVYKTLELLWTALNCEQNNTCTHEQ